MWHLCTHLEFLLNTVFSSRKNDLDFCSQDCYEKWSSTDDWKEIDLKFSTKPLKWTEKTYKELWQDQGFTKEQAQQYYLWQGFTIIDFMFLTWLKDDKKLVIEEISKLKIRKLRTEYNQGWTNSDVKSAEEE